jgi:hypothetical protein
MTDDLSPVLKVYLIDLLSRGGSIFLKDFTKPSYSAPKRRELIKLGFISEEKIKIEPKQAPKSVIEITEKGWSYLDNKLNFPEHSGSRSVSQIFSRLLERLSASFKEKNIPIKELFPSQILPAPAKPIAEPTPEELLGHIRKLQREQPSLFMSGGGLRISNLQKTFHGLSLSRLHEHLLTLQKRDAIVLYRFDDPGLVNNEDRGAELRIAGEPRHYLFLK